MIPKFNDIPYRDILHPDSTCMLQLLTWGVTRLHLCLETSYQQQTAVKYSLKVKMHLMESQQVSPSNIVLKDLLLQNKFDTENPYRNPVHPMSVLAFLNPHWNRHNLIFTKREYLYSHFYYWKGCQWWNLAWNEDILRCSGSSC